MEKYANEQKQIDEEMQLVPLIKLCFEEFKSHWWWFVLSAVVCTSIGWFYQQKQQRIYQRQAVMLIEDSDASSVGGTGGSMRSSKRNAMNSLLELNGVSVGDNLKNEIFILSSKRLMLRVVEKLHIDVDYTMQSSLHTKSIYGQKELPFEVLFQKQYKGKHTQSFKVAKKDANTITLKGMHDKQGNELPEKDVQLGQMVQTPYGQLCVVRGKQFNKWSAEDITVSRLSIDNAAERFLKELTASEYDKETSLIVLSCSDNNAERADQILACLYDTYKEDVVENKNRVAMNTAKFIDERIRIIGHELSSVENQLASFKKRNKLVDFSQSSQAMLTATNDAHQQSLQLETQLNVARYLNDYLHSHSNNHDLIPALNISDASFNSQIAKYNDVMNQRNQMASNSSEKLNIISELDRQLAQMRQSIAASLKSYVNSVELRLRDAQANESLLSGKVSGAPDQEKQGLDIQRQQSLKEALYTYLLNKREEVALQQAINEANVRLVEGPIGGENPVLPKRNMILLISLIIGLIIPTAILWIKHMLDVTVHGRKDIEEATTIPVLGEVPVVKDVEGDDTLITSLPSDSPMVEAFRILRFGLGYMRQMPKVLMSTSTTPGQGKSFVTRNMAVILSMAGKKVIVIDADIRKRTLSRSFRHTIGLTTYLSDEYTQVADIIKKDGITKGVDFIPAGHLPPNPSELLMSNRLEELVKRLRSEYDYVLFDTTPMFSVADASIVNSVADTTLFIIRVGVQNRDFLPELETMYQNDRFKSLCVVVNGIDPEHGYHGYGYGYGYGFDRKKKSAKVKNMINRIRRK